ncbi:hypothetical protein JFK97_18645 [Chromobacterium phragmitis]|uniref:hypothetical protein n=1 Tax=Chromobacterium amazonense TaxID=1382803 RepID=UPI0021B7DEFE|nr:hypothetical protein [Chromobacterium amazonense]MBM2886412.1 hypothetical protein [Chromobacterium amazonense]MDE1715879.1 hypothetical protein [Chromobacterium amazonense]
MQTGIEAIINSTELFGHHVSNKLDCRLWLDQGCSLIFAELLPEPGKALDILAKLNEAFAAGLPEEAWLVESAGFFTFSANAGRNPLPLLAEIFPAAPIPLALQKQIEPAPQRTGLWICSRFDRLSALDGLIELGGKAPEDNQLLLYGVLNSSPVGQSLRETWISAGLPSFKLLGMLEFRQVKLEWQLGLRQFKLQGEVRLAMFGQELAFRGSLNHRPNYTLGLLQQIGDYTLDQPFDPCMAGVSFGGFALGLLEDKSQARRLSWVQGTARFGALACRGKMMLSDGKPTLAILRLDQSLKLSQLADAAFGQGNWPANMLDLEILPGSLLYYRDSDTDWQSLPDWLPDYAPLSNDDAPPPASTGILQLRRGYNAQLRMVLTLFTSIGLRGDVQLLSAQQNQAGGVKAQLTLDQPISLFVLELGNISPGSTVGPELFFSNIGEQQMGLACQIRLLQTGFGLNSQVRLYRNAQQETEVAGQISGPAGSWLGSVALDFSYSKRAGLRVQGWPTCDLDNTAIDFLKRLREFANATNPGCGELAEFVNKQVLQSRFKVSLNLSSDEQHCYLIVQGKTVYSILGQEVTALDFPVPLRILLPDHASLDDLPALILQAIADATAQFIAQLASSPQLMSMICALQGVDKAFSVASQLVCKGFSDASVPSAAQEGSKQIGNASWPDISSASVGGMISVIGSIFGGGSSCFVAGTQVLLADGSTRPIECVMPGDLVHSDAGQSSRVRDVERPLLGARRLYALNQGAPFVTDEHPFATLSGWKAIAPQATLRENPRLIVGQLQPGDQLRRAEGDIEPLTSLSSSQAASDTPLYNLILDENHSYFANGYLVHNKGGGDTPDPVRKPLPPAGLSLKWQGAKLVASWQSTANADRYVVTLLTPSGSTLERQEIGYQCLTAEFALAESSSPGRYQVSLKAGKSDFMSPPSIATMIKLNTVSPTFEIIAPHPGGETQLKVSWAPVEAARGYALRIQDASGSRELPSSASTSTILSVGPEFPAGGIGLSVVARADGTIPGAWSQPQFYQRLPAPVPGTAIYRDGSISLAWQPVSSASSYQVWLIDPNGTVSQPTQTADTQIGFSLPPGSPGGSYAVVVRSWPRQADDLASAVSRITIAGVPAIPSRLPPPSSLVVSYQPSGDMLQCQSATVVGAIGYQAELVRLGTPETSLQTLTLRPGTAGQLNGSLNLASWNEPGGSKVAIRVRALAMVAQSHSDWRYSDAYTRLPAPSDASAVTNPPPRQINIDCSIVAGANAYQAQLFQAQGSNVTSWQTLSLVPGSKGRAQGQLDVAALPDTASGLIQLRVRALGGGNWINSNWTTQGGISRLTRPVGTQARYDAIANAIQLTFNRVDGASAIQAQLASPDGVSVWLGQSLANSGQGTLSLATLPDTAIGKLQLRLYAVAGSQQLDSAFLTVASYVRAPSASKLTLSFDRPGNAMTGSFETNDGSSPYHVDLLQLPQNTVVASQTASRSGNILSYRLALPAIPVSGASYQVSVYGQADDSHLNGPRLLASTAVTPAYNVLRANETLSLSQKLLSPNGLTQLAFDNDGNLILSRNSLSLWDAGTFGPGVRADRCVMQGDGNLVVTDFANQPHWSSNTQGHPGSWLEVLDGAIQIRDVNAQVIWTSALLGLSGPIQPASYRMMPGQSLLKGQDIFSQDKTTRFSMQTDDNLVLYQTRGGQWVPIWAAGSNGPGNSAYKCKLFADGDLAVVTYFSDKKWASGTGGHPSCWLDVESGRIVLRNNGGIVKVLP